MTELERLLSQDNCCLVSVASIKKALEQEPCYNPDEWCRDRSEYDQNKHCCPRFNNVIRKTVEEIKRAKVGHWIPVSERLPDKNGRYLVTVKQGYITFGAWVDVAENWAQVTAWMPLPEPYEPQESEKTDADSNYDRLRFI
jgi:hypothetical protein